MRTFGEALGHVNVKSHLECALGNNGQIIWIESAFPNYVEDLLYEEGSDEDVYEYGSDVDSVDYNPTKIFCISFHCYIYYIV